MAVGLRVLSLRVHAPIDTGTDVDIDKDIDTKP